MIITRKAHVSTRVKSRNNNNNNNNSNIFLPFISTFSALPLVPTSSSNSLLA